MRVKILEGHSVRLERGLFHGGIECELSNEEIKEHASALVITVAVRDIIYPPPIEKKPFSETSLATPEADLKSKLNTA